MTSRAVVAAAAVLCLAGYTWVYATGLAEQPIRSDGFSYYVYLPSWFLHGDSTLRAVARDCCGGEFPEYTAIIRWPGTRRWVNAHPIGVAVMQAPFFLLGHALTRWTNLAPDGFSLYYQHAAGLAGLGWIVAGLAVLRLFLRRYFSDPVVAATLAVMVLGTNLFHYATFDSSYSHPYSFFLFAAFLELTVRWFEQPTRRRSIAIGLVSGLIVLTRHPNALVLLVFPLYGVGRTIGLKEAAARLLSRWRELALIAAAGFAVILPQFLIYRSATGRFLVSSYGALGFNWTEPRLYGVLFSVTKGLFFWSPVLLIAVAGLARIWRSRSAASALLPGGVLFLIVNTYVIASWWDWQFGGSYGHRGFVDAFPLFALGLAAGLEWTTRGSLATKAAAAVVVSALVMLSAFQMLQYWYGIIPYADTTWAQYRALFLEWR